MQRKVKELALMSAALIRCMQMCDRHGVVEKLEALI